MEADLSGLTSGEKAFIWLLFTPIALSGYQDQVIIGATVSEEYYYPANSYSYVCHPSLDLSKITSVNMFLSSAIGDNARKLYWVDANNKNIVDIPPVYTSGSDYSNVQVPSGAKGLKIENIKPGHFQIISFTTTDGKVHTADNLNY